MNKKSPANFGLSDFAGAGNIAARSLLGRGGGSKTKTKRALKKIDERLGGIEETLQGISASEQAVPTEGGLTDIAGSVEDSLDANNEIETPGMETPVEIPSAVQEDEDTYATAGSALSMMKKIARRK